MERLSALYAEAAYKGRVKLEAGREPRLGLKMRAGERPLNAARALVQAWAATATEKQESEETTR